MFNFHEAYDKKLKTKKQEQFPTDHASHFRRYAKYWPKVAIQNKK
jgi:hypothetical protein